MNTRMDAHELQRETDALRRIARGVLFEPALAEDAVQEAWLAALRAPASGPPSGGWLTQAVRRIARGMRREQSRRMRREHAAAASEAQPSAADSAARVELLRELLNALEALEEPYRTAVQLRLVDDLPPRAIAERLGVPVETARTRVKRGIEKLRARLDARHAQRRGEFLAALAPLALPSGWKLGLGTYASSKTILGGLMSAQVKLASAALIVVVAALFWWHPWSVAPRIESERHGDLTATVPSETDTQSTPQTAALEATPQEPLRVGVAGGPLPTGWVIRGRALREKRQPLPGATISVQLIAGYDGPGKTLHEVLVRADASGAFEAALPRANVAVRVRAQGNMPEYLCLPNEVLVLRDAEPPAQLDAICYPLDIQARGRVRDAQGVPIRGAHVQGQMAPVETDAEGRFELRSASAFQSVDLRAWADGFVEQRAAVVVHEPGVVDGIEIQLLPGAVLHGRVVDENGNAVAAAHVKGFPTGHAQALSDREGRFALGGLPAHEHWQMICVRADGFAYLRHDLEDGRIPAEELTLVLQRGVELLGQVLDEAGQALPGADVVAGRSRSDIDSFHTLAGDEGRFTFACLPRTIHELHVEATGCAPYRQALALPERGAATPLRVVLQRGATVHGIVVDDHDTALPELDVYVRRGDLESIENASTKTGADGHFTLQGLPRSERLTLEVIGPGLGFARQEFDPSAAAELRVVLRSPAGLAGRVVDAASGQPLTTFRVRFVHAKLEPGERRLGSYSGDWMDPGHEIRDADGRWDTRGENLAAGEVTGLEISAPGYGPAILEHAVTRLDPEQEPVVTALRPGASIGGRVVDAHSGAPIAGARVVRLRAADEPGIWGGRDAKANASTATDANGNFHFEGLPLESMTLAIEAAGYAPKLDGPFEPDTQSSRSIELSAGATLRGVLRDSAGRALAHEPISISGGSGELRTLYRNWALETDAEGRFELRDLMPATYGASRMLRFGSGTVGDLTQFVTVSEARVYELELRPRGSGHVNGSIQVRGKAAAVLVVRATREGVGAGEAYWRSAIASEGKFELEGLEPGHWTFSVWEPATPETSRQGNAEANVAAAGETSVSIELLER